MDKYSLKRSLFMAAIIFVISAIAGTYVYAQRPKEVFVTLDTNAVELYTSEDTLGDALKEAGFFDLDDAKTDVALDTPITDGMEAEIFTNKEITLVVGGKEKVVETFVTDVDALLIEEGVDYDTDDEIIPARHTALKDGDRVVVNIFEEKVDVEEKPIAFKTVTEETSELYIGESEVYQEGEEGVRRIERKLTLKNGKVIAKKVISNEIVKEAVNKVILEGTKEEVHAAQMTQAPTGGYTMIMNATAYTHTGNPTASGAWPQAYYTVAVDPSVIPLGTSMYIEGYGYAVAQDTGGAVRGNIIDLFFDTTAECIQWGRRNVAVTILN